MSRGTFKESSFLKPNTGGKIGRLQDEAEESSAMEETFKFIESSDDSPFTLEELNNVDCEHITTRIPASITASAARRLPRELNRGCR
ncbi:hypothetical protein EVAR_39209_1 [Eumeta japonica]|uniref:Uncharacterized protein n=1 Tax=Eumeta variegata TaxID=151549 RepID=A0A4C1VMU2_EUMVA|nr:hypothetical protein EVAR_39209_1 [Eumeta japonica]